MATLETNHASTDHSRPSLLSLPRELLEQILVNLPINDYICEVALSSKMLSQILLTDLAFARTHFDRRACVEPGGMNEIHIALDLILDTLPITYLAILFQSVLEDHEQLYKDDWVVGSSWSVVSQPVADKLVAHLSPILEKQAVPRLLQWIYESQYPSSVAAMMILADNEDLPLSHTVVHSFMLHAITCGWREVVQSLMDRRFEVLNHGNHALETAADQDNCEMVALLLQDRRVDLSFMDYRIINCINSLEMAEVLLLDDRIPNGQFLLSVLQGDIEAVEAMLAEKDWDPSQPSDWSLKFATNQNRPDILEALLADERVQLMKGTQNVCMKLAVEREMWRVFDVLKAYSEYA
ncbi:hypothetical protein HDU78_004613 [Chytriomyces hyalinus]|nr:hypothetical protein HDU78_004613 [Chytriomyces hyalinus]